MLAALLSWTVCVLVHTELLLGTQAPMQDSDNQGQLRQNNETSAPPVYSDSQIWIVPLTPCPSQRWDCSPPAYETLTDLPSCCVPPTDSQLNSPAIVPKWCRPPQAASQNALSNVPAWHAPPGESFVNNTPAAQQHNMPPTTHVSNVSFNSPTRNPHTVNTNENSRVLEKKHCTPKPLVIVQILTAFVQLGSGAALSSNEYKNGSLSLSSAIIFWAPVFAKWKLFLNLMSLALSCVGLALNIFDLQVLQNHKCFSIGSNVSSFTLQSICQEIFSSTYTIYYVLIASNVLVIILSLLLVGVARYILYISVPCPQVIVNCFVPSIPPVVTPP